MRPAELQDPMVAFSIFSGVTLTHAGTFPTVATGLDFVRQLLLAFIFGFSIAIGVSLFVLPLTSRLHRSSTVCSYRSAGTRSAGSLFARQPRSTSEGGTGGLRRGCTEISHDCADWSTRQSTWRSPLCSKRVAWGQLASPDLEKLFCASKICATAARRNEYASGYFPKSRQGRGGSRE